MRRRSDHTPALDGVPDVIGPGLQVLFCGINPGALSGARGQHFARPGNRFWKALHGAGFTDRVLQPAEQWELLRYRVGITNLVARTTVSAAELTPAELREGAAALAGTVAAYRPASVAVLGVQAYRVAFHRPRALIGPQPEPIAGSRLWMLPNPSGLQARYQLPEMIALLAELRASIGEGPAPAPLGPN